MEVDIECVRTVSREGRVARVTSWREISRFVRLLREAQFGGVALE
jgi:hypothetical protein